MELFKKIQSALISVYDKTGLEPIVQALAKENVTIYSTGGTLAFIESLNIPVVPVEDMTSFPEILGGRVKTLHPKIFGGILHRRELAEDLEQVKVHGIPAIDLVIVDLYPFEDTVASVAEHSEIIEKIDIGGISLIRAGAKNYQDVVILPEQASYANFLEIYLEKKGTDIEDRAEFATRAFRVSSHYDTKIFEYFNEDSDDTCFKQSIVESQVLRYGENPHQKGVFYGSLTDVFDQLHGKELSYNNLLDVEAAVQLMGDFLEDEPTFAILKHNNACGIASRPSLKEAYDAALAADPVSAFGGILIANRRIDLATAEKMNDLFCEVVIAPAFEDSALELLKSKKNRILLVQKMFDFPNYQFRSILNGVLAQDRDFLVETKEHLQVITNLAPSEDEIKDLLFANKIVKHTKSNTIVLVKNGQMLASGTGQTSRVDALRQAIHKAKSFSFNLKGAVMASDAFFPFPDCVEIAHLEGIDTVIQPGGSIKDDLSIAYCNANDMKMVMTGNRHFKH
jgi:phosphoribosylaminoimidazolecarboxamide formyltransferase / IMP cyclohydrolase